MHTMQLFSVCRLSVFVFVIVTVFLFLMFGVVLFPSLTCSRLRVESNPPPTVVEGGAQVKQNINVECLQEFKDRPLIDLQFTYVSLALKQHVSLFSVGVLLVVAQKRKRRASK